MSTVKTVWKKIEAQNFKFYCVGCHKERRIAAPSMAGSPQFFLHIALATIFFSLLTWPLLHWKGLMVLLIPVAIVFETIYRLKMRSALICPECTFDPILYLVDREKAVRQVDQAWRKKFEEKGIPYPEKKRMRVPRVSPKSAHVPSQEV